jgi:hypothetical protein
MKYRQIMGDPRWAYAVSPFSATQDTKDSVTVIPYRSDNLRTQDAYFLPVYRCPHSSALVLPTGPIVSPAQAVARSSSPPRAPAREPTALPASRCGNVNKNKARALQMKKIKTSTALNKNFQPVDTAQDTPSALSQGQSYTLHQCAATSLLCSLLCLLAHLFIPLGRDSRCVYASHTQIQVSILFLSAP